MKLCNHRRPKNAIGACMLTSHNLGGGESYNPIFMNDNNPQRVTWWRHYTCTAEMAQVCPYRKHSPNLRFEPFEHRNLKKCEYCTGRHYSNYARAICRMHHEFKNNMTSWSKEGSTFEIYPNEITTHPLYDQMWRNHWASAVNLIFERDKYTCQDCGLETDRVTYEDGRIYHQRYTRFPDIILYGGGVKVVRFEVHHIVPRGMGGTDNPANLKLICEECHSKYNEKFNGEIISRKARERKAKRLKVKGLEAFDASVDNRT